MKSKFNQLFDKIISEQINSLVKDNIKDGLVYHGSPFDLDILSGNQTGQWSGEQGSVFVTPFKGLTGCFMINKNQIIKYLEQELNGHISNLNFGYNVWNFSNQQLQNFQQKITIELNLPNFKQFTNISTGYLYTIDFQKYKNKTHMFNKNVDSDVEFLIEGNVDFIKKQKKTVFWRCVFSEEQIKRHGIATIKSFNNIQNIEDLKNFYNIIDYDIPQRNQDFDNWKLLSIPEIIKYKVGICYDTAYMTHLLFNKWNIEHINCFACTERNFIDHIYNDPTHTFTVYKDKDNKWKWLEGSWEDFKNNDWQADTKEQLISWILTALANSLDNNTYIAAEFKDYPKPGTIMDNFYHSLKGMSDWIYKSQIYEKPYSLKQIKQKYSEEIFTKLKNDPVHRWRAETRNRIDS